MYAWRFRASRLPLFYGENGVFPVISKHLLNRCNAGEWTSLNSRSASALFGGGYVRFKSRGIPFLHHSLHTSVQDDFSELDVTKQEEGAESFEQKSCSSLEDGDWSELGHVKDSIVIPKLHTEKPELYRQAKDKTKTPVFSSSAAKKATKLEGLSSKPSKSSPTTGHKLKAQSNGSRSKSNKKNEKRTKNLTSSTVPDVPSSVVGIRIKNNETSTKNLTSITVLDVPSSVVSIRISNLNLETADSEVHSMCTLFGSLEGLARVDKDTVEALFRVRDSKEADSILEKLNETTVDDFQWSAEVQCTTPMRTDVEPSLDQRGLKICSFMEDLEKQISMRMLLKDDLGNLLHSVLHLENHPMSRKD